MTADEQARADAEFEEIGDQELGEIDELDALIEGNDLSQLIAILEGKEKGGINLNEQERGLLTEVEQAVCVLDVQNDADV